jgi:hypothetical protein
MLDGKRDCSFVENGRKNWRKEGANSALSSFKIMGKIHLKEQGFLS